MRPVVPNHGLGVVDFGIETPILGFSGNELNEVCLIVQNVQCCIRIYLMVTILINGNIHSIIVICLFIFFHDFWRCGEKSFKSIVNIGVIYESQVTHSLSNQAVFCLSACWTAWTCCEICVRKYFALMWNSRAFGLFVNWLDLVCEKSQNNGKRDHTLRSYHILVQNWYLFTEKKKYF